MKRVVLMMLVVAVMGACEQNRYVREYVLVHKELVSLGEVLGGSTQVPTVWMRDDDGDIRVMASNAIKGSKKLYAFPVGTRLRLYWIRRWYGWSIERVEDVEEVL